MREEGAAPGADANERHRELSLARVRFHLWAEGLNVNIPLQVTFRRLPHSEALEARIREKAEALERFYPRLMACRVGVEEHHRHHRKGRLFHIRIDMTVPGAELVVNRDPELNRAHEDPYVAVRDAFEAARRQLQDWARRHRDLPRRERGVGVAEAAMEPTAAGETVPEMP